MTEPINQHMARVAAFNFFMDRPEFDDIAILRLRELAQTIENAMDVARSQGQEDDEGSGSVRLDRDEFRDDLQTMADALRKPQPDIVQALDIVAQYGRGL